MLITGNQALVEGIYYVSNTNEFSTNQRMKAPKNLLDKYKEIASPIVRTYHYNRSFESGVHLGAGIILTNHHVVFRSVKNYDQCDSLTVSFPGFENKTFSCEKVLLCSPTKEADYCFMKLKPNDGFDFNSLPVAKPHYEIDLGNDVIHYAVGNTLAKGLTASMGKGMEIITSPNGYPNIKFHAAVFGGNSGGAIFDSEFRFVGLTRSMIGPLKGDSGYNMAIPLIEIQSEIEEILAREN